MKQGLSLELLQFRHCPHQRLRRDLDGAVERNIHVEGQVDRARDQKRGDNKARDHHRIAGAQ